MAQELPPEIQEKLRTLQSASQQLQMITQQRSQMDMMRNETRRAKEALEALDASTPVYRSLGGLLIADDHAKALERLGDEIETLDVRLKRVKEQESKLTEQLQGLESEIQKALGG